MFSIQLHIPKQTAKKLLLPTRKFTLHSSPLSPFSTGEESLAEAREAVNLFFEGYKELLEEIRHAGKHYKGGERNWLHHSFAPCSDVSYSKGPALLVSKSHSSSKNLQDILRKCELDVVSLIDFSSSLLIRDGGLGAGG